MGYTELIRGLLVYEVMGSHHHTYHREPSDASLMEDYSLIFMQISVVPKEPHPSDLIEIVLPVSTEVIFLNLPVEDCIANAKSRPWEPQKYDSKVAQDENLGMLIDWIAQYAERNDPFSRASHEALYRAFPGEKTMYVSNERGE
jgi:hypothetical protein